ncbi:MAG: SAM-dependent methyltransferase, partial [Clostridia bacterium]|nr:SAM-dependent methyltransferase [Clostridia bacterium]
MTDKRLLCVASMVREKARLADIGTDHAHLPVYLLQQNRIVRAIAADIGEGPADAARRTVQAAGLQDKVTVRVGDGLSVISPEEVTDIVIAGMGGETIVHILKQAPWLKKGQYRLVLQPMSKTVELRAWLYENGFTI